MKTTLFILVLWLFIFHSTKAQYIEVADTYTEVELVENVFIGLDNLGCIEIFNVEFTNWYAWGPEKSYGYFNKNNSDFQLEDGVLLTTGRAVSAVGPNNSILSEGPSGNAWPGDSDLEQAIGINNTVNATALEFDFIAQTNSIKFDYIFASEQYLIDGNQSQCGYTDAFAFLIKRVNTNETYTNLAVIPNTDIPVAVNTVRGSGGLCPPINDQYFQSFNEVEHPTNYNGQTKILTAQTDIIPGEMYHIKLVIADQGNNLYDSAVFLKGGSFSNGTKSLGQDRLIAEENPICQGNSIDIDATTPNAISYQWYRNGNIISGATNPIYSVVQDGDYSVEIGFSTSGCLLLGAIKIEFSAKPLVDNISLIQCENQDGTTFFNLRLSENKIVQNNSENFTFTYFENLLDAQNNTQNRISNPTNYNPITTDQTIYTRVENQFGCYDIGEITLFTSNNSLENPSDINSCETTFNLLLNQNEISIQSPTNATFHYFENYNDALLSRNEITQVGTYEKGNNPTIYVKILENGNCYGMVWFDIFVRSIDMDFSEEIVFLCEGQTIELSVPTGFSQYLWNNGQNTSNIIVNQPGEYSVTITNEFGCEISKKFIVNTASIPTIIDIKIDDMNANGNFVTINVEGIGDYQYSLNGTDYQQSNFFSNVVSGKYMVRVKGVCGDVWQDIFVLDYPKFFTPNGDGINDYWQIPMLAEVYPMAEIHVFDRYGRLLAGFSAQSIGWDGISNNKKLPATDYWFVVRLPERKVKGHFSLLR